jgi:hypothetical protein
VRYSIYFKYLLTAFGYSLVMAVPVPGNGFVVSSKVGRSTIVPVNVSREVVPSNIISGPSQSTNVILQSLKRNLPLCEYL